VLAASWPRFLAVCLAIAIGQGSQNLMTAALAVYLRALGTAPGRIGAEVSASSVVAVVCTLGTGPLINRWGARRIILAGMAAYLVAALGLLAFPAESGVAAFRAMQGIGAALVIPSSLTVAPRLAPTRPGVAIGALGSANTLAYAIGPPLGLWLYANLGPRGLFIPAAICAALGFCISLLVLPNVRGETGRAGFGFDRRWSGQLLANALCSFYFGGVVAYLPLALAGAHGPNAGIFFTADALGVLLLRAPTGILVDRLGPRGAEAIGVGLTLAGLGLLFLPATVISLVLAGAGTGTGAGLFLTAVLIELTQHSHEANRGTAMALGSASFNLGIFAGGTLAGVIVVAGGFQAVLLLGLATTACALPFVLAARSREQT
jgi:MFS family permease